MINIAAPFEPTKSRNAEYNQFLSITAQIEIGTKWLLKPAI
jgi:hypothetical protein